MIGRTSLASLALVLVACGAPPRPQPPVPWDEGAKASAEVLAQAAARPWIRLSPQGTSMCVRLPDGSFHSVHYGVGGGTDGFSFLPSQQIPVTRDVDCSSYGVTALGEQGVVSYFGDDGRLRPSMAYPTAERVKVGPGWTCFLDRAGHVFCDRDVGPGFDVNALGPVAELVGDTCALYRDGTFACRGTGGATPYQVWWTDARQASVAGGVMCVVLASGQVSCLGDNRFSQRGFTGPVDHSTPTLVPGLEHVDEVHTSGTHVCARKGGEVWCWGEADHGEAGETARQQSVSWKKCEVDAAATEQAKRQVEEGRRICSGPRPAGDDPFCRSMSGAYASTVFKGNPGYDCDPSGATRFALPTRVDDISDAIALATRGSMTCALRTNRALTCWGSGARTRKETILPVAPIPVEGTHAVPARGLTVQVNEWGVLIHGDAGSLTFHPWRDGPLGAARPLTGVVDAILSPGVCTLAADVAVACEAAFDSPARTAAAPEGYTRFASGHDCFLSATGALHCPRGSGWGARLTAAGDVVDLGSRCARFADGAVRCLMSTTGQPEVIEDVLTDVTSLSDPLWPNTMCAVRRDASVWCVGGDFDQRRAHPPEPVAIAGAPPSTSVAASYTHACVLAADQTVWCWGRATEGQAGEVAFAKGVVTPACKVDKAATAENRLALRKARAECRAAKPPEDCLPTEYQWVEGCEPPGPYGTTRLQATPVPVPGLRDVVAIGVGTSRTCAVTSAGELSCWGDGSARVQTVPTATR